MVVVRGPLISIFSRGEKRQDLPAPPLVRAGVTSASFAELYNRSMNPTTDRARELRRLGTDAEQVLWDLVRDRRLGGYKFRRQVPLGGYVVDFVCREKRLIVELDGSQHQDQSGYDAERTVWLGGRGYEVLRLWNNEFLEDPHAASERILATLEGRSVRSQGWRTSR